MTIQEYFGEWSQVVDLGQADSIMRRLLSSKETICPKPQNIFNAFRKCQYDNLKIVILGQDPYPNSKATGIAFANPEDTPAEKYSPSLEVLKDSIIDFTISHGYINFDPSLEKWEEQGVLLLNTALSCLKGVPGSHCLIWRPFTRILLENLSRHNTGIVYVLMGNTAQSFEPFINKRFNHVIRIRHPSYYVRTRTQMPSDVWHEVDRITEEKYNCKIKWYNEINY